MGRSKKPAVFARLALAALLLPAAACFERPIDEELEIRFPAPGGLVVSSSVRIAGAEGGNAALEERLTQARRELEAGDDAWSRDLAACIRRRERLVLDRKGTPRHAVHRVYVKQPSS
jgi:hypothetical protein